MKQKNKTWVSIGASIAGAGHVKTGMPCQDYNIYGEPMENILLCVVCDGAGSKPYSQIGSKFVAERAYEYFSNIVLRIKMYRFKSPSVNSWNKVARRILKEIVEDLADYAKKEQFAFEDLACTVMVAIVFPRFLLMMHVGDGRGAYRNSHGEWNSFLTPFKGEYASETVFLNSPIWNTPNRYIESRVIVETASAIALLSDGCERSSFLCNQKNENDHYYDPNLPYTPFFELNVKTVMELEKKGLTSEKMNALWSKYLENGNENLKNELDDKTMVLAVRKKGN